MEQSGQIPTGGWKVVLRLCTVVLSLPAIAMTAFVLAHHPKPEFGDYPEELNLYGYQSYYSNYSYYWDRNEYKLPWTIAGLGLSITWCLFNIIAHFRRGKIYIKPGVSIGCEGFLWLYLISAAVWAIFVAQYGLDRWSRNHSSLGDPSEGLGAKTYPNGTHYLTFSNGTDYVVNNTCAPLANCDTLRDFQNSQLVDGIILMIAAVMTVVVMLFHAIFFFSATRHRRHYQRRLKETSESGFAMTQGWPHPVSYGQFVPEYGQPRQSSPHDSLRKGGVTGGIPSSHQTSTRPASTSRSEVNTLVGTERSLNDHNHPVWRTKDEEMR